MEKWKPAKTPAEKTGGWNHAEQEHDEEQD
jgi:hypothetical protein